MNADKPRCVAKAKEWGYDYWDGNREYGYGGYYYDQRWKPVAAAMIEHYGLERRQRVLDIGCGKAHLIHEMRLKISDLYVQGIDISEYAASNSKMTHIDHWVHDAKDTPFKDNSFDFTYSINLLHNFGYTDLKQAIREMVRVGREKFYVCVESFRNDEELMNLQCWALTCKSFYSPDDWKQILCDNGYKGDVEFIYFT